MFARATVVWIAGLLTVVPYGTYYLFFHAQRDEYAFLITFVLFWIFGYWGVVGPLLAAIRMRQVMRLIETAHSRGKLVEALRSEDTQEAAIELIASENKIPRWLARRVLQLFVSRIEESAKRPQASDRT